MKLISNGPMISSLRERCSVIACVALAVGCNQGPFSYVPVSGTVKYEDGETIPAASIKLFFKSTEAPADAKIKPRPAQAGVDVATGEFTGATSQKPNDGIVPGEHKVTVIGYDADGKVSDAIPEDYTSGATTPLVVHTDDLPFDLRIPKP